MEGFWYNVDSKLFASWSLWVGRGHNRENHIYMCLYWKKKFFSRINKPISIKRGTNNPWVKRILNFSNEGPGPLQNGVGSIKYLLMKYNWARKGHIYMEAFWYNVDSELFTSSSPGVGRGHNRENHIYMCLYWKKYLLQNQQGNFNQTWYKSSLGKGDSRSLELSPRSSSKWR
jgi:hypothetical protein